MPKFPRSYYRDSEHLPAKGRAFPCAPGILARSRSQAGGTSRMPARKPVASIGMLASANEGQQGRIGRVPPKELLE